MKNNPATTMEELAKARAAAAARYAEKCAAEKKIADEAEKSQLEADAEIARQKREDDQTLEILGLIVSSILAATDIIEILRHIASMAEIFDAHPAFVCTFQDKLSEIVLQTITNISQNPNTVFRLDRRDQHLEAADELVYNIKILCTLVGIDPETVNFDLMDTDGDEAFARRLQEEGDGYRQNVVPPQEIDFDLAESDEDIADLDSDDGISDLDSDNGISDPEPAVAQPTGINEDIADLESDEDIPEAQARRLQDEMYQAQSDEEYARLIQEEYNKFSDNLN